MSNHYTLAKKKSFNPFHDFASATLNIVRITMVEAVGMSATVYGTSSQRGRHYYFLSQTKMVNLRGNMEMGVKNRKLLEAALDAAMHALE